MVQGAYLCPDLPGHIVTAMVRQYAPGASGTKAAADVPPGVSRYPVSRLICGRASSAGVGSREPAWPACRTLAHWYGVNRDTLARPAARAAAGRQLGGNGAKMNTLKCGRSSTTGPSPPVNSRYRSPTAGPAGPYRPTVWSAVQVPGEHQREQVGGPGEHSDRVVIGDLAQLATANLEHTATADAGPARRGRWRTASRSALSPRPAWPPAVGDSNSQRPGKCGILVLLPDQAGLGRGSGRQGWTVPSSQR